MVFILNAVSMHLYKNMTWKFCQFLKGFFNLCIVDHPLSLNSISPQKSHND